VSSALETSVGISMGLHLAAAVDTLDYDCGLATAALLTTDVTSDPLLPVEGAIAVRRVDVASALLSQNAASPERTAWWLDRISRVYELLASATID